MTMRTFAMWAGVGVVVLLVAGVYGHRHEDDAVGLLIGAGGLAWMVVGLALALRGTLRWLRR